MIKTLRLFLVVIVVFLIVVGCDSNSADTGTAPKIVDAGFVADGDSTYTRVNSLSDGSSYKLVILIEDPDKDATTVDVGEVWPDGTEDGGTLDLSTQTATEQFYETSSMTAEPPLGQYQMKLTAHDAKGNSSSEFKFYYDIK